MYIYAKEKYTEKKEFHVISGVIAVRFFSLSSFPQEFVVSGDDLLQLVLHLGHVGHWGVGVDLDPVLPRRRLEPCPDVLVVSLAVPGELDGVELDLGRDDAVGLGVVVLGVQAQEGGEAEVFDVLEGVAKCAPSLEKLN